MKKFIAASLILVILAGAGLWLWLTGQHVPLPGDPCLACGMG